MKLLLVEDDIDLAKAVQLSLSPHFTVDIVQNGEDGIFADTNSLYDLLLLDISLPDISGLDVCNQIRKKNTILPIIFLTGKQDLSIKKTAFTNGCDDYITKPFDKEELMQRIHSVLRRTDKRDYTNKIYISDIEINLDQQLIIYKNQKIFLRHKDFEILSLLARNKGKIIKRQDIQSYIWGEDAELSESTIDVHINYIREHVEKPLAKHLIKTIHGVGFIIE